MTKCAGKYIYVVLMLLIDLALYTSGYPCKYTVRDIGFTDLGATDYILYIIVGNETSAEMRTSIHRIAYAAFLDANVTSEIIDMDAHCIQLQASNLFINLFRNNIYLFL